jgi:hypothetical protein
MMVGQAWADPDVAQLRYTASLTQLEPKSMRDDGDPEEKTGVLVPLS